MINELYRLTEALEQANIVTERTHPKYKLIPKVTKKAPCVHIVFDGGHIYKVENIEKEMAAQIRNCLLYTSFSRVPVIYYERLQEIKVR